MYEKIAHLFLPRYISDVSLFPGQKKVKDHECQPKFSSQIWHDNDFSIITLVKNSLATI